MIRNKFIVVEGIEGAGKTTASIYIKNILRDIGIRNVISVREPGSTELAEEIRYLVKKNFSHDLITINTELLLMYAARTQLIESIVKPQLKKGYWIIGDRHYFSSYAYQGIFSKSIKKKISVLQSIFFGSFKPGLTFFLDISPCTSIKRIKKRKVLDRIEMKNIKFFSKVRLEYLKLVNKYSNCITINAERKKDEVHKEIKTKLYTWIKNYE
ncbi:dTMP kinase [Buchnera aphidicola]|uniref:Thymidylate kinase n=1 Tax=Buchnera aphidicola (Anoecia oenotherae) TaxID=1241833 RepID=A0A4D6Y0M7_9GAMM|nr:dTMP kinase [Buchnera aphidicola]QCI19401.1 dTMP kinase [Buchnera aphidicola (Anoecia oenotherae)]